HEDDLERAAEQLARLDQQFHEQLAVCGGNPADDGSLERLSQDRLERESCVQRLDLLRAELRRLVPEGEAAVRGELDQLEQERSQLLLQYPELTEQLADEAEITREARLASEQTADLKAQRVQCERDVQEGSRRQQLAADKAARLHAELASAKATAQATRDELDRLGSEPTLAEEVKQAAQAEQAARARLAALQLSEAERTVDARLAEAERRLRQRQDGLQQAGHEIQRLRGVLQSSEGLHVRRAEAAAALREIEEALEREEAEAEAHRHLRSLFEQSREGSVDQVMNPIAARVLGWARHIGLDDYHGLSFGASYVPEGVLCGQRTETPVALAEESFGTEEQLSLLVRLALGGLLAREEPACAILDDPLAHTDADRQRRLLEVLQETAAGRVAGEPAAGPVQIVIFTCHPERFADLPGAAHIDLAQVLTRS
ncbi:MAG: hypothetical protein AB7K24_32135, partial [Gemmataceae bacterium]